MKGNHKGAVSMLPYDSLVFERLKETNYNSSRYDRVDIKVKNSHLSGMNHN